MGKDYDNPDVTVIVVSEGLIPVEIWVGNGKKNIRENLDRLCKEYSVPQDKDGEPDNENETFDSNGVRVFPGVRAELVE